jgi:aspartate/methionine/tyrosine aminotransferase
MQMRPELTGVPESPLVLIATEAERTPGAIKLCYGESDMPTPEFICRAAYEASLAGHTFYTHTAGSPELRQAVADQIFALHGLQYRPTEIMCSVGGTMAIYIAIRAFVGRGDNAVIISPAYAAYANSIIMAGGDSRPVPLARDGSRFRLDLDRVRAAIDRHTRMLIVNSPSNPTGWMMTTDEQRALFELAEQHDVKILSDEVYERLVYDIPLARTFAAVSDDTERVKERVIVINSFSKTYNMTGWRLGWAQASERAIRVMYAAAEFITSNPTAMVQQAAIVALRDGESYVKDLRAHYAARRAQVQAVLGTLPGVSLATPEGGFYAFMQIEGLTDSSALALALLREAGVALAPGSAFGSSGEGYLRMCFAASEATLTPALARIGEYMEARAARDAITL